MEAKIKVLAKAQNRIALGVIRAYVILHPETTWDDIVDTFPRSICPDSGVKDNFIDASLIRDAQGDNWNGFFAKEPEFIHLADGADLTMTTMWTKASLDRLLAKVAEFGIVAEKVAQLPEQVDELPGNSEPVPAKQVGYVIEYLNGWTPTQPEPAPAADDFTVQFEGLTFKGDNWGYANAASNAYNHRYSSYSVSDGSTTSVYVPIDRGAGEIIENLAMKAGLSCSASWSKNKIAEELLKKVLGDNYVKPTRGASEAVCNHAIINGYLVEHVYENDGCGSSDSIKRAAHVYLKK